MRLIDADRLKRCFQHENPSKPIGLCYERIIDEQPTINAEPERLTDDDFETIRIHLNAQKEKLCNQQRWEEAEEYQRIIDRFMAFASAEPERKLELHGDESAIEILSELRSWFSCFDEKEGLAYHALSLAIRAIKANSIVQAERKKGKWQWCGNHHLCSECDEWALTRWNEDECDEVDILTDFCPNCGADMRGEEE